MALFRKKEGEGVVMNYKCPVCKSEFKQQIRKSSDGKVSDQVKCQCGLFLPTWQDKKK